MSGRVYLHTLDNYLLEFHQPNWIFMQDNAPVHIYGPIKLWFQEHQIQVMKWPPYSLDLNPIEHVWPLLKEKLHDLYPGLSTMKGRPETIKPLLADAIIHCWELLDPLVLENLSRTMPHRIEAVKSAKGWYTKY